MKYLTRLSNAPVAFAFLYVGFPEAVGDSHYLETGGFIIPWIAAGAVAASVVTRMYWVKIKGFFGGRLGGRKSVEKDDDSVEN
jgi:hypothetical protein